MTDWHWNWRLWWEIDLSMIFVKLPFTSIYFYFSTCMYVTTIPVYWSSTGLLSSLHSQSTGLLPTCNSVLWGINIHRYDSITCLTATNLLFLLSYKRILWLSGILLFDTFLELLGSEFLQHTPEVNPWGMFFVAILDSAYDL